MALRPLFPKAKRINLKGATAGDGGVFHGGFAATAGEALAAACRPLPGGRGSAPSPPAQGPPGPLDLAASAPRHTDPAPRPSVAGCVHAPRRQESRPREPARRGPGDRGLHGRGPVSWDVEPAAPAAARFQLRCLRSPQLVRAVSRSFSGVSEEVWCFVTAPSQGHAVCSHQLYPAGGLPGPSRGTVGASRRPCAQPWGARGSAAPASARVGGPGASVSARPGPSLRPRSRRERQGPEATGALLPARPPPLLSPRVPELSGHKLVEPLVRRAMCTAPPCVAGEERGRPASRRSGTEQRPGRQAESFQPLGLLCDSTKGRRSHRSESACPPRERGSSVGSQGRWEHTTERPEGLNWPLE